MKARLKKTEGRKMPQIGVLARKIAQTVCGFLWGEEENPQISQMAQIEKKSRKVEKSKSRNSEGAEGLSGGR